MTYGSSAYGSTPSAGKRKVSVPDRIIELDGFISTDVLGGGLFSGEGQMMIRGYADLRDLAAISEPHFFDRSKQGYQREVVDVHAKEIKEYFESSVGYKFVPEIILSIRKPIESKSVIISMPKSKSEIAKIRIKLREKEREGVKIHRIDGNHRLHLAQDLEQDPTLESKYLVSFCILVLGETANQNDDRAEAIIFHNINSKAIPIQSEHALKILLAHEEDENKLFQNDPRLYATKVFKECILSWHDRSLLTLFGKSISSRTYSLITFLECKGIIDLSDQSDLKQKIQAKAEEMKAIFDGAKGQGCKVCEYFEIIPAIFMVEKIASDRPKAVQLINQYSDWLESNNLWAHFPEHEYTLFDVFYTIREGLTISKTSSTCYVNLQRLAELRKISESSKQFDLRKLIRLCEELNLCFGNKMFYAAGILLRMILDHVPPIFGQEKFAGVAGQASKSPKKTFERLEQSARNIADNLAHSLIRKSESLVNDTQVDFHQDLDVLLQEICRILG